MKKHTGKFLVWLIIASCFMLTLGLLSTNTVTYAQETVISEQQETKIVKEREFEQKIYSKLAIEDNFDDSSILVIIDKKISTPNKEYQKSFFGDVEMANVEDLTKFERDTLDDDKAINTDVQKSTQLNTDNDDIVKADDDDFEQILKINLSKNSKRNVLNVIGQLEKIEGIKYAGPNYLYTPMATNWGLNGDYGINANGAWGITKSNTSVKVGIIDTGINSHSEFGSRLATGREFINNSTYTYDDVGHGTSVAAIVGGATYGVAPNVTLVPLKVCHREDGLEEGAQVVKAIKYAKDNGISILNFSGGWSANPDVNDAPWDHNNDPALYDTIKNYPGLFVCSAGNNSRDNDTDPAPVYPASYDLPNLISVGAIDSSGNKDYYSNYGAKSVDIFAPTYVATVYDSSFPGTSAASPVYDSSFPGTSAASPFVAGTAALMLSVNPNLTPAQIKTIILDNVDKATAPGLTGLPSLYNKCVSKGRLNAYKAVACDTINISTAEQLSDIRNNPSFNYKLVNNITLSGSWTPIPTFTGNFNGNYCSINNMSISIPNTNYSSEKYFGLFATLAGTISNLNMKNITISSPKQNSGSWVSIGGIAGRVLDGGTISYCTVSTSQAGNFDVNRANSRAGGIAGDSFGAIKNCINYADIWIERLLFA